MPDAQTAFHLSGVTLLKGKIRKMRDGAQTNKSTRCRERVYSDTILSGFGCLQETLCHVLCLQK